MGLTALVVLVPEAEAAFDDLRQIHDPMAVLGVLAHVTVLHPFRKPVDAATQRQVAAIARAVDPFEVVFSDVGSFPGVVYLAPDVADPFVDMTRRCVAAFPDCPPYNGRFSDTIPHLTVGARLDNDVFDQVAADTAERLPIRTTVDRLTLLTEIDDGTWAIDHAWELGRRRRR